MPPCYFADNATFGLAANAWVGVMATPFTCTVSCVLTIAHPRDEVTVVA